MVSTLVVSSKGMLFTNVFTCICYRMYIHKINVTCHKHTWWVKEANGVYVNPKIFRILNALKFKYLEVLEKISDFERFTRVKEFSSYQKHSEKDSTVLTYFVTEPILKECFKIDEFLFSGLG